MFLLFLTTVQLNARIPQKLASWTLSYGLTGLGGKGISYRCAYTEMPFILRRQLA